MKGLSFSNFVLIQDIIHLCGQKTFSDTQRQNNPEEMTKQIKMKSKQRFQD